MAVQDVMLARRHECDGLGLRFYREVDHRRRIGVLGEQIVPSLQNGRVDQNNLARDVSRLLEICVAALRHINDRNVFDRSERRSPGHRHGADVK